VASEAIGTRRSPDDLEDGPVQIENLLLIPDFGETVRSSDDLAGSSAILNGLWSARSVLAELMP
jgi:hypothetical protein